MGARTRLYKRECTIQKIEDFFSKLGYILRRTIEIIIIIVWGAVGLLGTIILGYFVMMCFKMIFLSIM